MKKQVVVATAVMAACAQLHATTLYEGFDYPVGTLAEVTAGSPNNVYTGRTNPFGPTWYAAGSSTTDTITVTSPGLSGPAWLGGSGNSAEWAGFADGNAARVEVGPWRNQPGGFQRVYYSLSLQINDISVLQLGTQVGNILAGFNTLSGPQIGTPGVIGTRLFARQHPSDSTKYQLAMSKNSSVMAQVQYDGEMRNIGQTYFIVGSYLLQGDGTDLNDVSQMWIAPDSSDFGVAENVVPTPTLETQGGGDMSTGSAESFLFRQSGPSGSGVSNTGIRIDEVRIGWRWADVAPAEPNSWTGGSANWSNGASWSMAAAPNAAGTLASFGASGSPVAVNVDSAHTLGTMHFNSSNAYTIGGSGTLTMEGSSSIVVFDGAHTISAPLNVAGDLNITTATGDSVAITNMTLPATGRLVKAGYGTATVNNIRTRHLSIHGGTLAIGEEGGDAGMSVVEILDIPAPRSQDVIPPPGFDMDFRPRGVLDLKDNALLVRAVAGGAGSWSGSAYTGINGLVQLGRNGGDWDGRGLLTSMSDATGSLLTTLAVGTADELGYANSTFRGQTVNSGDVLVMYTWGGDAEMDGDLDGDDYFWIDSNVALSGTSFGYHQGDFDYDGDIDGDDYFIIDSNIAFAQTQPPFETGAGAGGLATVPEPAGAAGIGLVGAVAMRRKRRRSQ